jgi:hypothetical protein
MPPPVFCIALRLSNRSAASRQIDSIRALPADRGAGTGPMCRPHVPPHVLSAMNARDDVVARQRIPRLCRFPADPQLVSSRRACLLARSCAQPRRGTACSGQRESPLGLPQTRQGLGRWFMVSRLSAESGQRRLAWAGVASGYEHRAEPLRSAERGSNWSRFSAGCPQQSRRLA